MEFIKLELTEPELVGLGAVQVNARATISVALSMVVGCQFYSIESAGDRDFGIDREIANCCRLRTDGTGQ